ncbi:MAG: exodeoxyribonuclease III [Alphaproteobacteria bacterium]|nr:exodeoxyribonuclease III [Alphaproteobacteria bacterium]MCL2505702.1 exodeoxyribonuclease III [Alphaproteobacteria bacterium]
MKIAAWNVNSIRARLQHVTSWLDAVKPDILLLQEIKCETNDFPVFEFSALGYKSHVFGQKSYNGVAILSLHDISSPVDGLPSFSDDANARYIEAVINNVTIASVYAPNGNPIGSDKFTYKLKWLDAFYKHAQMLRKKETPVIFGGDFNVVPTELDVFDTGYLKDDALYHTDTRKQYHRLINNGYTDIFRALHTDEKAYTFWDYTGGAWAQNRGIRLDYFFLSPPAVDIVKSCTVDSSPRSKDKASDHVPIILEIK